MLILVVPLLARLYVLFHHYTEKKVVIPNDFNLTPNRICIRIVPNSSCYLLRLQKCCYLKYNLANAKTVLPKETVFAANTIRQLRNSFTKCNCLCPKYYSANTIIVLPNTIVFVPNTIWQMQKSFFHF